jgi:hypothetical protein
MTKLVAIFLVIFGAVACTVQSSLPPGETTSGFRFPEPEKQRQMLSLMEEHSIPYETDEEGFIIHLQRDLAQVRGLKRKVAHQGRQVIESIFFVSDRHKSLVLAKFEEQGIYYDSWVTESGTEAISWPPRFNPQVDLIVQQVDSEL